MNDMRQYRKIAQTASLKVRRNSLKSIVESYKDKTDISEAEQELKTVNDEYNTQTVYYQDSLSYYKKMVAKGITGEECADILKRIIDKFKAIGIDTTEADEELGRLNKK